MIPTDHISLEYFNEYHSGHCGYCGKNNSVSIGMNSYLFEPETYEKLMNKGWRRCGTYYYKFDFKTTCCLAYTIRANALQNQQKKSHRKIAKRLLNILKDESLKIKQQNLLKQFESIDQMSKQKKQQKQQVVVQNIKKQNIKVQQIDPQTIESIKQDLGKQLQHIQQNKLQFAQSFQKYIEKKQFDLNAFLEVLNLDLSLQNVKIFQSQILEKGDYYSNFIQCLYGLNKKALFQDYTIQDFALDNAEFVRLNFQSTNYIYVLETTGYLSIFNIDNKNRVDKHIKQVNKQSANLQKELVEEKPSQLKQNIEVITKDGFLANNFFVGKMKIVLKKAQFTEESFVVYKKYCYAIHEKSKESKDGYDNFLCQQGTKCSIVKSIIDPTKLLFTGSYHMNYYIEDRLIAVGVVDITPQVLSSVYFFYDPEFEDYNIGTFGALVEIEYIKILNQYFPNFQWYYLGFYIQHSQKMVYKGEYQPAQLLCPQTYNWVNMDESLKKEISKRQVQKQRQINISDQPIINDLVKKENEFNNIKINVQGKLMKLNDINKDFVKRLQKYLDVAFSVLGRELMNQIIFDL